MASESLPGAASAEPGKTDDLSTLTNLSEDTLLTELGTRYQDDNIYTFVGDILVAVNPFKQLPIYDAKTREQYSNKQRWENKPHVYTVADACYHNLFEQRKNQCAIISGESGAGKTESAKFILKHIIDQCKAGSYGTNLEEQILKISPLLEAFGNATTVMNHNSSRFGKYTRLLFDNKGSVMGIQLSEYLLEKSRVVEQTGGERNFHVLYYLFSKSDKADFFLTAPDDFPTLGGQIKPDNAEMLAELIDAMETVGFDDESQKVLFSVLAAVIHLGAVEFDSDAEDHAEIRDMAKIAPIATLLKVSEEVLAQSLLGLNTVTRGEHIRRLYTAPQAYDCRDALAKALYASLFGWIVSRVNELLAPELHQRKAAGGRPGKAMSVAPSFEIGVLDIFGFENFNNNSFEQMCINLAHEQLQYFFNRHTFLLELDEYEKEGIDAKRVSFKDNQDLINMFLGKPMGLLALLDTQSNFPQSTDQTMVDMFVQEHSSNDAFVPLGTARGHPAFAIAHFAGKVEYNADKFLEKNRDNLAGDIVECMQESKHEIVQDIFFAEILNTGQIRPRARKDGSVRMHRGKEIKEEAGNTARRRAPTLATQFRNSLDVLVKRMTACYPHFVRCIKPNQASTSDNFDSEYCRLQLLYTGVLEATRIRREGYSWRPTFANFVERYKILAFPVTKLRAVKTSAMACEKILQAAKVDNYLIGKTKMFLKYYHLDRMEDAIATFHNQVISCQTLGRMYLARKRLAKLRARAAMDAAQRAEAERLEEEARLKAEQERREREEREEAQRLIEEEKERVRLLALEEEQKGLEQEAAAQLAEARRLSAIQLQEQELQMTAEAIAEKELREKEAEEERKLAEAAAEETAMTAAELEALQTHLAEVEKFADESRKEKEEAEEQARQQRLERTRSKMRRKDMAVKAASEAKARAEAEALAAEQARLAQQEAEEEMRRIEAERETEERRLREQKEAQIEARMKEIEAQAAAARAKAEVNSAAAAAAREAQERAAEVARRAEQERREEERRLQAERDAEEAAIRAADYTRDDFWLVRRVNDLLGEDIVSEDVTIDKRTAKGYLNKLGAIRKHWKKRYFVFDIDEMTLKYFDQPKAKKPKGQIDLENIMRVFVPPDSKTMSGKHSFVIETLHRTFHIQAFSDESRALWVAALNAITSFRPSHV